MSIVVSSKTTTVTGPTLPFNCPDCNAQGVSGQVKEAVSSGKLYFVIPVFKSTTTWITCPACNAQLNLKLPLARLLEQPPESITLFIRHRAPMPAKILALLGALLFWVPALGAVLAAVALYLARGTKGWPPKIAKISLVAGIAVTITVGIIMFTPK
jgi:hypothetical protein